MNVIKHLNTYCLYVRILLEITNDTRPKLRHRNLECSSQQELNCLRGK